VTSLTLLGPAPLRPVPALSAKLPSLVAHGFAFFFLSDLRALCVLCVKSLSLLLPVNC